MKKILLIEDDPDLGTMIREFLNFSGYETVLLRRAPRTIEMINSQRFDLCILDVMIADLDGREICREIRERSEHAKIPILMMSALEGIAQECIVSGADDFIPKPFDITRFLGKIEALTVN